MFEIIYMQPFFLLVFFFFDTVKLHEFEVQSYGSWNYANLERNAVDLIVNGDSIYNFLHFLLWFEILDFWVFSNDLRSWND